MTKVIIWLVILCHLGLLDRRGKKSEGEVCVGDNVYTNSHLCVHIKAMNCLSRFCFCL